jgi:hypothetical protein
MQQRRSGAGLTARFAMKLWSVKYSNTRCFADAGDISPTSFSWGGVTHAMDVAPFGRGGVGVNSAL